MSMIGNFKQVSSSTLDQLRNDPSIIESIIYSEGSDAEALDIDKAWHVIHYLLTGNARGGDAPLANAILGGEEIGDDVGYGPVRYLTPAQVKEIASALSNIPEEELKKRFNAEDMNKADIYPGLSANEEDWEYISYYYRALKDHYNDASIKGNAMLLYLN